jgi:hypothetical protein
MKIFQNLFHRHTFDLNKWKALIKTAIYDPESGYLFNDPRSITGHIRTFSNTCLECGNMIVKQVKT